MEGLQLRSLAKDDQLEVSLERVTVAEPKDDEVVVRIDATPINPSDIGLLFGGADMTAAKFSGAGAGVKVIAPIPTAARRAMAVRAGQSLPVGNEGAGEVIKTGAGAKHLLGKTVAILGGAMYAQYRTIRAADCLLLPEGTTAEQGASCFVNPLTALGMTETMRREGHTALVHTAAASNLGQMLNKLCLKDGIGLVNVVRKRCAGEDPERHRRGAYRGLVQAVLHGRPDRRAHRHGRDAGVRCDRRRQAGRATPDGDGGRRVKKMTNFSRYGSTTYKQVYIYGGLDTGPTELNRAFGMAWGLGGWLLTPFLIKIGPAETEKLRQRVAREIRTTFASRYTKTIALAEMLGRDAVAAYNRKSTGEKYLVNPNKGL